MTPLTPDNIISLALAVLFLPLAGFLLLIFFNKRLPRRGDWLETSIVFVALALSALICYTKVTSIPGTIDMNFPWVSFGNVPLLGELQIHLGIAIDNIAALMLVVVCLVSALVHLFRFRTCTTTCATAGISRIWASSRFRCSSSC